NCSNNYGPYQFPEKLIPLFINNIVERKALPVYGEGLNVRDWLYVGDHVEALDEVFHRAAPGSTYNIGGNNELRNIDLVHRLVEVTDRLLGRPAGDSLPLITFVTDRKGHDLRYAIDASHITADLGWHPRHSFEKGLEETVRWYLDNPQWLEEVKAKNKQS
ncbi:MAG: GDP-mannose 4,6-dehydratase, partial [Muribaculaceae bacterium]|nr:GDP-mannose 4,6-dehydratase [Muribaculaceae bacterium]